MSDPAYNKENWTITEETINDLMELGEYLGGLESAINHDHTEKWARKWSSTIKHWRRAAYKMWISAET